MHKLVKKAFTLIELLVVIAIIGILSGLIIVTMGGVTQKAGIAKAQVFSNSLRNSLMLNLVSDWKIDEGSGTSIADSWSGGNSGTLSGFSNTTAGYGDTNSSGWVSSSNCVSGTCLQFDGSDDAIIAGTGADIGLNSMTWSFWGKTTNSSTSGTVIYKASTLTNWVGGILYPYHYGNNKQVLFYLLSSVFVYSSDNVDDGKWHYVVASCDRSKHVQPIMYIDGRLNNGSTSGYCDTIGDVTGGGILRLGYSSSGYFVGMLDDVRIYNAAMPTSQIKEHYYAGLNKLLANGGIIKEEYKNRIGELAVRL